MYNSTIEQGLSMHIHMHATKTALTGGNTRCGRKRRRIK
jgi:hypothetical protein